MTPRSKGLLYILLWLLIASVGFGFTNAKPHPSPDGRFMIVNVGDTAQYEHHFELRRSDGSVVFSVKNLADFELPSFAEDILWSKDAEFVALSFSTGKYRQDTLVIATATGKAVQVPDEDLPCQTRPVRWTQLGELVVETKAPFGGKSDDDLLWLSYQYRRTVRIRDGGSRIECVYRTSLVYPYRAQLLKDGYKPR
jgi:hypothetical protein